MFKGFIEQNRPRLAATLDDTIATGEVWFGTDAVELGLCDEIATVDEVMNDYVDDGWNVYEIEYKPPSRKRDLAKFITDGGVDEMYDETAIQRAARWLLRTFASELKAMVSEEISRYQLRGSDSNGNNGRQSGAGNSYTAHYDRAESFRAEKE